MWECPSCRKEFARQNQSHKCEIVSLDTLFAGKKAGWRPLYNDLLNKMQVIKGFKVTTSAKAITLYAASGYAFMGLSIKTSGLDLWFALDEQIDEFPVYRIVQAAKNRFGHFIRLTEQTDIDQTLLHWLQRSYHYINSK